MANIPNSNRYQTTGSNNAGNSRAPRSQRQPQQPDSTTTAHSEVGNAPAQFRPSGGWGIGAWLWVIGFGILLFRFPIQTLSAIAIFMVLRVLFAKR